MRILLCLAGLLTAVAVQAQVYKWVDKDGKVQYTDSPPPAGAAKAEPQKVYTPPNPGSGGKSLQERAKDSDKARTEGAEKAKKDAEAAKLAEQRQQSCNSARGNLRNLQGGGRVVGTNAEGERTYMDDEQREKEIARVQQFIDQSCK